MLLTLTGKLRVVLGFLGFVEGFGDKSTYKVLILFKRIVFFSFQKSKLSHIPYHTATPYMNNNHTTIAPIPPSPRKLGLETISMHKVKKVRRATQKPVIQLDGFCFKLLNLRLVSQGARTVNTDQFQTGGEQISRKRLNLHSFRVFHLVFMEYETVKTETKFRST